MKLEHDLDCPHCKRAFRQKLEEMRPGAIRICPHCEIRIEFTGDDGRKAQRVLDDLQRELQSLFR